MHIDVLERLTSKTGKKYFSLLGTTPSGLPELVAVKLNIIKSEYRPPVADLLDQLQLHVTQPKPSEQPVLPGAQSAHLQEAIEAFAPGQQARMHRQVSLFLVMHSHATGVMAPLVLSFARCL